MDLVGRTFGYWTVLRKDDERSKKTNKTYWICRCKCSDKEKSVREDGLLNGKSTSCGCAKRWTDEQDSIIINAYIDDKDLEEISLKIGRTVKAIKDRLHKLDVSHKYPKQRHIDLTGQKFGRLFVNKMIRVKNSIGRNLLKCDCTCDCGNSDHVIVSPYELLSGTTKSCGCYIKERLSEIAKKDPHIFEECDNYCKFTIGDGTTVLIDIEDKDIVSEHIWHQTSNGYIANSDGSNFIFLHRLIMSKYYDIDGLEIDHIHGKETRNDNRKENLRIVTSSQNSMNVGLKKNNTSGVTGVSWDKYYDKWVAYISKSHRRYTLGYFDNFNDAIEARKEAEEKLFGEYSYSNSQSK